MAISFDQLRKQNPAYAHYTDNHFLELVAQASNMPVSDLAVMTGYAQPEPEPLPEQPEQESSFFSDTAKSAASSLLDAVTTPARGLLNMATQEKPTIGQQAEALGNENTVAREMGGAPVRQSVYNQAVADQLSGRIDQNAQGVQQRIQDTAAQDIRGQQNREGIERAIHDEFDAGDPTAMDIAKGAAMGANKLVSGIGFITELVGADETGKSIREAGDRGAKFWNEKMTQAGQLAAGEQVFIDDDDSVTGLRLSDKWGSALLMGAAQSLPSMLAAGGPGALAAKGIQKLASLGLAGGAGATIPLLAGTAAPVTLGANITARIPSAVGFGAAEGVTAGAINAAGLKSSIEEMSFAELEKSPVFKTLSVQHGPEKAREMIAEQASKDVFGKTALATGTIGALTGGGALAQAYQKVTAGAKGGVISQTGKAAAQEAIQEAPQSGSEALIENIATRDFLDPSQDITEGVLSQAASGAAIGAATGGVFGAGGAIQSRQQRIALEREKLRRLKPQDATDAAAAVNTEQTQQAVNNIASAQNVDEAINAASEAVKQKPVSSRDVWDSLQAKDQLLAEAERVGIDNPLQGDLNASSQEAQEASAEAGVLEQSASEGIDDSLIGQDELSINDDDIPDSAFDDEDIDTIGSVSDSKESLEMKSKDEDYRMQHVAPSREDDAPLHDITKGGEMYPDDIYSSRGVDYYGTGDKDMDSKTMSIIHRMRGKPNNNITIYRAIPKDINADINPGDWVTINKQYADNHGAGLGDYKIISKKVKVKDLFTNGDSIHEFGYSPEKLKESGKEKDISIQDVHKSFNKLDLPFDLSEDVNSITLKDIDLPASSIAAGKPNDAINQLIQYADGSNKIIKLSVPGGTEYYEKFGFVKNSGNTKDTNIRASMYRKPENSGSVKQFAGQLAQTANISKLDEAKQLIKDGADPEKVRQSTGWHQGVDNKWRFEIDDSQATIKKPFPEKGQLWGDIHKSTLEGRINRAKESGASPDFHISLGDIVDHPALFEAYPELADISVGTESGNGASFSPKTMTSPASIEVGNDVEMYNIKSLLMHEVQHAIQFQEGFATGTNPKALRDRSGEREAISDGIVLKRMMLDGTDIDGAVKKFQSFFGYEPATGAQSYALSGMSFEQLEAEQKKSLTPNEQYFNSAGEIEARNTQERLGMNANDRRNTSPEETQDVPSKDAIISFGQGKMERAGTDIDYEKIQQRPGTTEKQREQGRLAFRDFVRNFNRRSKGRIVASSIPKDFREKSGSTLIGQKVASAGDLAAAAQVLRDPRFETFRVFYVKDNKVVHHSGVTSRMPGSVDVVIAKDGEKMSDAWKRYNKTIKDTMKRLGADGYYLLHNHPSGNADPSEADISFTKKVQDGAPGLIAHVVINSNEYGVLGGEHSLVPQVVKKNLTGGYGKDATIPHRALNTRITKTEDIAEVGKLVQRKDGFFTAIALNAQLDVVSLAEIPMSVMSKSKMYQLGLLRSFARNSGGTSVAIVADKKNIHRFGEAVLEDVVLNVVTTDGESHPFSSGKQRLFETGRKKSIGVKETAWHGSPHDHDKFSMDKVGTGEGAQAFGHGLYFAGKREVAEFYRDKLKPGVGGRPVDLAANMVTETGSDAAAITELQSRLDNAPDNPVFATRMRQAIEHIKKGDYKGRLYRVDLKPKEDEYLLWDKSLEDQSDKVRESLMNSPVFSEIKWKLTWDGHDVYDALDDILGSRKEASLHLRSIGIRGIKYLDNGSRDNDDGSFNYVIFDDSDVSIEEKLFSRASNEAQGVSDDAHFNEIKSAVDELKAKWAQGPNVTVVKSVSDLSQFLDKKVTDVLPTDADGLYDPATDSAYVVADNILHPDRAKWVALHEVIGHGGLRKLDKSVNESIEFASKNKFVRDLSHSIARRRNESYNQRVHIQEAIAELAAASLNGGTQKLMFQYGIDVPADAHKRMDSAINRIVEAIRRFLGKIFGTTTNQQIRDLITAMKIATEQGRANGASDDYIRKSLMIERAGYEVVDNFVIPETEEYADNTTGDLGHFPGNSRVPAGPIRVKIGEATGNHRGFGLMHIVDSIRKDPKRLLVKRTKDTAEDTMRGVVATIQGVREVYRDGNVFIFVNPRGKRAFVGEFKDGYYSVVTERPHREESVEKYGKPLWSGRVLLPNKSQKGVNSPLPLPGDKHPNLVLRGSEETESLSGERTGTDSANEQNSPNRPGIPQAQRRKISISKSGNLIQQNSEDNQPLLSRATTLTDAGVNTEVEPQADDNVLPEETKTQAFRRRTQDAMLRFKVVQDWLKKNDIDLSEAANVYQRENISKGKMANKIDDFRRKELQPLIERIAKESKKAPKDGKFDLEDIVTYLEAVHIPEANAKMREIHKDKDATANGITDEQAKKVQADFESMPNFQQFKQLAEEVRNIGTETLQMRLDAGLISQEQFDAYKKTYSHWVPLRGNMKPNGFGKGMSTVSKDKRRLGHALRDNEMILENIVQDREKAIMQVEKNKVGLSVAQFILEAKNDAIGTISKPEKMATIREFSYAVKYKGRTLASYQNKGAADAAVLRIMQGSSDIKVEGESLSNSDFKVERTYDPTIVMMAKPTLAENEIQVYVNGHAVRLQLNDPGLARAATNAGIEQVGAILQGARMFNRFLSKAYTAWSPDFLFMNMARDAYSGTLVLTGKKGASFAAKTMTNYAFAIKELFKSRNDPSQSQWVQRYRDAGGNIGAAYLDDLERVGESAVSALQEFAGARETYRMVYNEKIAEGASASKARTVAAMKAGIAKTKAAPVVGHLFKTLENVNAVIENSLRLATFKTAIESGESDQAAASLSKDLMNFNRKGEIANTAGALYLFYNPGMQGIHIVGEALTSSPHKAQVWGLLGGLTALSFMLSEIGRGLDEDEWENIPDHVKDRNMIFHIGDKQVTIPVAYGFGVFHAMGNLLSNYNHGEDPHEIAVKLASATFENFSVFGNPLIENGDTTDIRMDQVMPTIPKMIMGPGINMDSMGKQVTPIKYQESQPDSQNMTRTVRGTIYDDLASFLNDTTGGTKYTPGLIDISPNTIKYWVTNLTGGAGRFVSDIVTGSMDAAAGVEPELENVPVARKFVRNPGVTDARNGFWNSVKETETATERFRKAIKDGDVFRSQQMLDEKGDIIALAKFADKSKKMSARYRDAVQEIQNDDNMTRKEKKLRIKELEVAEQKVYESFLKIFREAKR